MKNKETFLDRLYDEYEYVCEKYTSLLLFLQTEKFQKLDFENQLLLNQQQYFMDKYLETLKKRIEINQEKVI